ncbi:hypothetical protein DE4585_04747 [Mycobacteroides salmoniphilum]|uniref:Uncharacterized protein n=1 Tax=Mycobacteroides salmoniphilum TaxID=404941 RepID=A0A4R8RTH4_9MYCO|nr:hypothetical protein [Mycobacteroides salmoniphilum]TDZ77355.1 hypothetical protein DE4585_04747 [Mycobacteroides salmoniphilum]
MATVRELMAKLRSGELSLDEVKHDLATRDWPKVDRSSRAPDWYADITPDDPNSGTEITSAMYRRWISEEVEEELHAIVREAIERQAKREHRA